MTIKVKEAEHFRTASELYDGKWTFSDSFKATDEKGFLVVTLPRICDRNIFRITIIRKGQRKDHYQQNVTWDAQYGSYGYLFNPKAVAASGGPGQYEAKFYSGNTPVMRHTFSIR